ncbi:MAG: NAD(P)-dependent alcohol dehydrogenase [Oceanococcus sp.]
MATSAYAALDATQDLQPFHFERRALRADDVHIEIEFCGVCHSDLHTARNDWGGTVYPVVPGHEIVGVVKATGPAVTKFKLGERVAVGCIVDSCMQCHPCEDGEEQYCERRATMTYGGKDRRDGAPTQGGYASDILAREEFVLRIPEGLDPAAAAPLLCAGITTWSPLQHAKVGPGMRVGVIGLGGLGHMALKFAHALGAAVSLFTTSPSKADEARRLGAQNIILSTDAQQMKAARNQFDLIVDTVPRPHELGSYLAALRRNGSLALVGPIGPMDPAPHTGMLMAGRKSIVGSMIGGIAETQDMLDFCAQKSIVSDIEMIKMQDINQAYERMLKNDVHYRFVIDMASLA